MIINDLLSKQSEDGITFLFPSNSLVNPPHTLFMFNYMENSIENNLDNLNVYGEICSLLTSHL